MKLKLYVFKDGGSCDWSCGDRIIAATSMEEAHRIAGNAKTDFGGDAGKRPDPEEHEVKGFHYVGAGGA